MNTFLLLPSWAGWIIALGVIIGLIVAFVLIFPVRIWIRTISAKCPISLWKLYSMRIRKSKIDEISEAYINCKKSSIDLTVDEIEAHHVSGGNVVRLSDGLIMAKNARISLTIDVAKAIDLSGRDLVNAVKDSISPKMIETDLITAVAKDGFEVKTRARITLLASINKLIGGANEQTIATRVGEALMTEIGNCFQYSDFMQKPEIATKNIATKNLDEGSAFKILSINISEMMLGKNIEAQTLLEEAEIDKQIAQAKAEERKAMAVAYEQEAKAKTQEAKAGLIDAESQVPKAIASAFDRGNIGVAEYYKLENMIADTEMRKKFGETDKKGR